MKTVQRNVKKVCDEWMCFARKFEKENYKCNVPVVSHGYVDIMRIHRQISEPEKSFPLWVESQKIKNDSTVQIKIEKHDYISQISTKQRLADKAATQRCS